MPAALPPNAPGFCAACAWGGGGGGLNLTVVTRSRTVSCEIGKHMLICGRAASNRWGSQWHDSNPWHVTHSRTVSCTRCRVAHEAVSRVHAASQLLGSCRHALLLALYKPRHVGC